MGHVELLIDWREEVPVINIAIGCTEKSTPKCDVPGKSKSEADLGQLRLALGCLCTHCSWRCLYHKYHIGSQDPPAAVCVPGRGLPGSPFDKICSLINVIFFEAPGTIDVTNII